MSGRVAFLSGPGQGIGRATVEALLADGWVVAGLADVAEVVRFLLDGERAGFVTGQTWTVDGGMTRRMRYAD